MSLSLLLSGFVVMLVVVTTSAYVPTDNKCPAGERHLTCGGCQPSCQNPSPVCTLQCREGCYCPEGLLRDTNGNCVSSKECQPKIPTDNNCPAGERYLTCGGCQPSCQIPSPVCTLQCREGCYCPEGLLRDANGNCVSSKECQRKSGNCPIGEIYLSCGSCQRTCDIPNPICTAECREGCYCRDGFLRNSNGKCVTHKQC